MRVGFDLETVAGPGTVSLVDNGRQVPLMSNAKSGELGVGTKDVDPALVHLPFLPIHTSKPEYSIANLSFVAPFGQDRRHVCSL